MARDLINKKYSVCVELILFFSVPVFSHVGHEVITVEDCFFSPKQHFSIITDKHVVGLQINRDGKMNGQNETSVSWRDKMQNKSLWSKHFSQFAHIRPT